MRKVIVIKNEQHQFLPEQLEQLNKRFGVGSWEDYPVPADGWTKSQMDSVITEIANNRVETVVFLSPIPYLIKMISVDLGLNYAAQDSNENINFGNTTVVKEVLVFHNDRRVKKELPNGKVISVTAQDGWELV